MKLVFRSSFAEKEQTIFGVISEKQTKAYFIRTKKIKVSLRMKKETQK